jgi:hypothetical protein
MIANRYRFRSKLEVHAAHAPRVNRASPQSRGLVAWWPLSSCTGNVAPDVFQAGHGTAAQQQWRVDAAFGPVPQFDGNGEISFSDGHLPAGASPRTLCAWVSFSEIPIYPSIWGALFYGSNSDDQGLMIGAGNHSHWNVPGCLGVSQWGQEVTTPQSYHDGTWHHLAAAFDGTLWSVYVDGSVQNSRPLPTNTQSGSGSIGGLNYGSMYRWKGLIRDVRIYGRGLSAAEVRSFYDPATRFDLWLPRGRGAAESTAELTYLIGAAQIRMAGPDSGQVQSAGAVAGEVS